MSAPNILLIQTDQHSPHIAGFAGDRLVQTPALDRLAAGGTVFDAAYCQSPLCVPSRTSMLTGTYALNCAAWDSGSILFPDHPTLPGWLAEHGYTTASVGKMHFRGREQMHGWQYRPYGDLMECMGMATMHQPDPPETADGRWNRHAVGRFPFAGPTHIPEGLLADTLVTRESLAWLAEYDASDAPDAERPWFFCASYSRPHFPLTAPERYIRAALAREPDIPELPPEDLESLHPHDRFIVEDFRLRNFSPEEHRYALACYHACIAYVDDCIGDLLAGMQRLGLLENTCIVYTTDHGDMASEHGLWWKRTYYDASVGVPLIISGPGLPAGERVASPVELVDLFPTFCSWAGCPSPEHLDGEDLSCLLDPARRQQRRKHLARSELLGEKTATRFRMIRDERWKLVEFPAAPPRLFDLRNDPDERHDLAAAPPADAPLDELQAALRMGLDWPQLDQRREQDRERAKAFHSEERSAGATQFRLRDGRIVAGDAQLYASP